MPEKPEAVNVRDLLNRATENLKTAAPPVQEPSPTAQPQTGVIVKNGRKLYQYVVDGEVIVLPKPIGEITEEDFYRMPVTLADVGAGRLPADLNVKFRDPQYAGFWFNKKAGDGRRIGVARSLKFVPAKLDDLEWHAAYLNDTEGAVTHGDVVLFKIHKAKLFSYYKQALDKARRDGGVEGYKQHATSALAPTNQARDPYYLTPQAVSEYQGVGDVAPSGEEGILNLSARS